MKQSWHKILIQITLIMIFAKHVEAHFIPRSIIWATGKVDVKEFFRRIGTKISGTEGHESNTEIELGLSFKTEKNNFI